MNRMWVPWSHFHRKRFLGRTLCLMALAFFSWVRCVPSCHGASDFSGWSMGLDLGVGDIHWRSYGDVPWDQYLKQLQQEYQHWRESKHKSINPQGHDAERSFNQSYPEDPSSKIKGGALSTILDGNCLGFNFSYGTQYSGPFYLGFWGRFSTYLTYKTLHNVRFGPEFSWSAGPRVGLVFGPFLVHLSFFYEQVQFKGSIKDLEMIAGAALSIPGFEMNIPYKASLPRTRYSHVPMSLGVDVKIAPSLLLGVSGIYTWKKSPSSSTKLQGFRGAQLRVSILL